MRMNWLAACAVLFVLSSGSSFAAKPDRQQATAVPAPEIFSVKIDYTNGLVIV